MHSTRHAIGVDVPYCNAAILWPSIIALHTPRLLTTFEGMSSIVDVKQVINTRNSFAALTLLLSEDMHALSQT